MNAHAASPTNDTAAPPPVSFAPLACPPLSEPVTAMHPRVYLAPDVHGEARCPYCGARYASKATSITRDA